LSVRIRAPARVELNESWWPETTKIIPCVRENHTFQQSYTGDACPRADERDPSALVEFNATGHDKQPDTYITPNRLSCLDSRLQLARVHFDLFISTEEALTA
ncbi:hypothetical protein KCU95_g125, partial [Aureobasidium melanogenum]